MTEKAQRSCADHTQKDEDAPEAAQPPIVRLGGPGTDPADWIGCRMSEMRKM